MPDPIRLALVWHMHQPSYRDAESAEFLLPWTRLHATKDYRDMVALLRRYPRVHATFNLTPVLLDQLDAIAAGQADHYLTLARRPASDLSEEDRGFLRARFFDVNPERMLEPHEAYRDLHRRAGEPWSDQEFRDLQVWFHLAWADPMYRAEEPLQSLVRKGRGFTEAEKNALLDWGIACSGAVAGDYRAAAASGQIELTTSAYYHPILPLLIDSNAPMESAPSAALPSPPFRAPEDAAEQVRRARESHERRFGSAPRGTWPPEGAVNDPALALLARSGFGWAASDEAVLSAALASRDGEVRGWPGRLYRPYRIETGDGPIAMVFRDRTLSDLIGFTYARWDAAQAADDFLRRVREAGRSVPEGKTPVVTVLLDGENCWETYPEDGHPFLTALYERLESDDGIAPVTVSEALEAAPPTEHLEHVPVGSWIRADLGIWVGSAEKNRAWEELGAARRVVAGALRKNREAATRAMEEILVAEASDWFWWYGDDHPSAHRAELDRLFRARLIEAYRVIGAEPPASLGKSLRGPAVDSGETGQIYRPAGAAGTTHRASGMIESIRYGAEGESIRISVELARSSSEERGASVAVVFARPSEQRARFALVRSGEGDLEWSGEAAGAPHGPGTYVVGQAVEIRIPWLAAGVGVGEESLFRIVVERGGKDEEIAPLSGWFHLRRPSAR
jgi:alpha-amylase/alpha-mannosidase (GH57 family)